MDRRLFLFCCCHFRQRTKWLYVHTRKIQGVMRLRRPRLLQGTLDGVMTDRVFRDIGAPDIMLCIVSS